jgi:hypothetical protein
LLFDISLFPSADAHAGVVHGNNYLDCRIDQKCISRMTSTTALGVLKSNTFLLSRTGRLSKENTLFVLP